jgi:hypothetical protein
MKKFTILIAAIALVCFSVPAMAVDWNFYGSARVNTWYVSTDLEDSVLSTTGDDKDSEVRWGSNGQDNSRLGVNVKHEAVSGRIEIQLKATEGGDPGSTVTVEDRLVYGDWNFGAGTLRVGKSYTPVAQFISAETFDEDLGLLGVGTAYGNRTAGLTLMFGGFQLALLEPTQNDITNAAGTATGGDVDSYIPKIEAKYGMAFDAFNFNVMGGYQYYSIEDVVSTVDASTNNVGVTSYIVGADAGFNFGPGYVKGSVSYGQNWRQASWCLDGLRTAGSPAVWDGDDSTDETKSLMAALVAGMKVSDMLSFEGGFGYRQDDYDINTPEDKDKAWEAYINSTIVLAPGVYLVPEIGYADGMKNTSDLDDPTFYWVGAKWQIDF